MPLKDADLRDEEIRLKKLIQGATEGLEAVRKLLSVRNLEAGANTGIELDYKKLSVGASVKSIHEELQGRWLTPRQMEEEILERNPKKASKALRTNVGNNQRSLEKEGFLIRKNIGSESYESYAYSLKGAKEMVF